MALCDEDFDVDCDECYEVSRSDTDLTFTALLTAETQYYLFVMDKFRNVDPVLITTDGNGSFTIDPSNAAYKDGMFNKYAGDFEVFIATDSAGTNVVELTFYGTAYNCVILTITSSTEINCTQTDQNQCLPSFVSDSDGIHELGENEEYTCIACGACDDVTVNVNGNLYETVASGGTSNVLVRYEEGTPTGTIVGNIVEIPDLITDIGMLFVFNGTDPESDEYEITAYSASTMTSESDDGASGIITYSINSGAYVAFSTLNPLDLTTIGTTIQAKRDTFAAKGWSLLNGTY